jgi:hypothetical protein
MRHSACSNIFGSASMLQEPSLATSARPALYFIQSHIDPIVLEAHYCVLVSPNTSAA